MSSGGQVQLQSLQMANIMRVRCYICEAGNHGESERCRVCSAPIAIAHQAYALKIQPKVLVPLSTSRAGKTTYLGLLTDILSRQHQGLHWLARGAYSVSLQQETMGNLARCEYPQPTPDNPEAWHWVHCQVLRENERKPLDLVLPDISGAAIERDMKHAHADSALQSVALKGSAALVLVDAVRAAAGGNQEDFATLKLLTFLAGVSTDPKKPWGKKPVAIVFTKADACDVCRLDPNGFAQQHLPGVWQLCQERFPNVRFFATSVSAGSAFRIDRFGHRVTVPLRIEPKGVVEPFAWLLAGMV